MTNAETPADNTGGNPATSATASLASIPPRIRVHALAKLLGKTSKEVLDKLAEQGENTRSAQSSVSRDLALKLADGYGITDAPAAPAGDAETAPVAEPPARPVAQQAPGAATRQLFT
ncbi:MAG: translation initiation factor IF-2 N-terminal domain-containing protein, partial [Thermocrispum sp.]